jgi:ethanolamine utilization protein EutQ (cupin superfamily)
MSDKSAAKMEEARLNNVLTSTPSVSGQQEQYYAYMLRKAKLDNLQTAKMSDGGRVLSVAEERALRGVSDLDQLELKALARLYQLSDNSPELLQYFAITKSSSREEVARKLAKKQLRKQLVEEAVQKVLPNDVVEGLVIDTLTNSRTRRGGGDRVRGNGFGLGIISPEL